MLAVVILTGIGILGLSSATASAIRKRAVARQRIAEQLNFLQAMPVADYRLRWLEQLVG